MKITKLWNYLEIKKKITKDKNNEYFTQLEITGAVSVCSKLVDNKYQHESKALNSFILHKSSGQLQTISFIFLKTFNSELSFIEV